MVSLISSPFSYEISGGYPTPGPAPSKFPIPVPSKYQPYKTIPAPSSLQSLFLSKSPSVVPNTSLTGPFPVSSFITPNTTSRSPYSLISTKSINTHSKVIQPIFQYSLVMLQAHPCSLQTIFQAQTQHSVQSSVLCREPWPSIRLSIRHNIS